MSMLTSTSSTQTWSPEVRAYAVEAGVAESLQPVLEMTWQIFPQARQVTVSVENDPEIAGVRFLVFAVDVAGLRADQAAAAQQRWTRELFRHCPATHVNVFCLGLNLVGE